MRAKEFLSELSTEKLAQYKKASYVDARKADAEGDYKRGDKRFKGINKATIKQFDNDLKKHNQQGMAEATPRHFGPKGAGTELARQIRANGELDRNKQPEPTGIPKKNEFTIGEPKAKIQVKKNKGVAEGCSFCGGKDHTALDEEGKASRSLCTSGRPDSDLGASQLASCKSQGLRARDGEKSHKLGKGPKSRVTVGGHRIKGRKYGGPLPDWS